MKFIKDYYRPIQPAVDFENNEIIYQEIKPNHALEHIIYCFWQLKSHKPLPQPFIYRVVSDGCIDIFFNHYDASESFIMGFCRKYTTFHIGNDFYYVGIRFLPATFTLIFGTDARQLSNQSQELSAMLPVFSNWIKKTMSSKFSLTHTINHLETELTKMICNKSYDLDLRFFNALKLIFEKKGVLDTEKGLSTGLSPRQLRRWFNYYLGTTPKAFCSVVRFQYILNAKPSYQSLKENKLYLEAGFFDQAHFIKDFKKFYGVTPTEAFR